MARSFEGTLADIPFMGGVLAARRYNEDTQARQTQQQMGQLGMLQAIQRQQQQQALQGILTSDLPDDQKMAALSSGKAGVLGIQAAHSLAQVQQQQSALADARRQSQFFLPQNVAQFQNPGSPAQPAQFSDTSTQPQLRVAPTAFDPSGGANSTMPVQTAEAKDAVAPSFDMTRFAQAGVMQGVKGAEPLLNHLGQREQAKATMEQTATLRREQIAQQLEISRQRSEDRTLSEQNQNRARMDAIRLAASLRPAPNQPAPIQTDQGLFDRGPNGEIVPLMGPDGKQLKPPSSGRFDMSAARQLQSEVTRFNQPLINNIVDVGRYDQFRASGNTAQAAILAADALRKSSRSSDRALKGEVERILGNGYGSGSIYERAENFIAQEFKGNPSANTMQKLDTLVRSSQDANLIGIASNLQAAADRARTRGLPIGHVAVPFRNGSKVALINGKIADFQGDEAKAKAYVEAWILENQ